MIDERTGTFKIRFSGRAVPGTSKPPQRILIATFQPRAAS